MPRIRKFKPPKVSTVIGHGTAITGDVHFAGGLHLDGAIKGNVSGEPDTRSTLTISDRGVVEGDVRLDNLILNGTVIGDVYADERVELASAARVTGTVYYRLLEMAMGAEVNGQLVHSEEREPRSIGAEPVASEDESLAGSPAPSPGTQEGNS
jgi:cytoskeletal protein CcmA (bactofilin family)